MLTSKHIDHIKYAFTVEEVIHEVTRFRRRITEEWQPSAKSEGFHVIRSKHRDNLTIRFTCALLLLTRFPTWCADSRN